MVFLLLFGAVAVLFGLWLRPKWRRARRERLRRHERLVFSHAREWWLALNAFGSIALGALMIAVVVGELYMQERERRREAALAPFEFACTRQEVRVVNHDRERRRIRLSSPSVVPAEHTLLGPQRGEAAFEALSDQELAPGEGASIPLKMRMAPCLRCVLVFDFETAGFDGTTSCAIH